MANGLDETVQGLLGSPTFNLGAGLLAASGPRAQPQSFGQVLGQGMQFASERQRAQLQNQAARQQLQQQAQRQQALSQLPGLLQPGTEERPMVGPMQPGQERPQITEQTPAPINQPGGRQEMLGLLGQAAPEAMAQGLLGQMFDEGPQRAETSLVRNVRSLADPTLSEDQRELIRQNIATDPNATDQQLQALDTQLKALQVQREIQEQEQQERSQRQEQAELQGAFRQDVSDARKLARLNDRLRDTVLETGVPMAQARRATASGLEAVKSLLGIGDEQAQQMIADFDEFNKTATRFASQTAARLFSDGRITNQQLRVAQEQTPSLSMSPSANDRIIADQLSMLLSGTQAAGVLSSEEREGIEELVGELQARSQSPNAEQQQVPAQSGAQQSGRQQNQGSNRVSFDQLPSE